MRNGSFSMHAVDDVTGVSVAAPNKHHAQQQQQQQQQQQVVSRVLSITPLDSPLVSPGRPTVLPNVLHTPDLARHGVNFNLHNNLWGTNYVMWVPYQSTGSSSSGGSSTGKGRGCGWFGGSCRCRQVPTVGAAAGSIESDNPCSSSSSGSSSSSSSVLLQWVRSLLSRVPSVLRLAAPHQQQQQLVGSDSSRSVGPDSNTSPAATAAMGAAAAAAAAAVEHVGVLAAGADTGANAVGADTGGDLQSALADQRVSVFR